MPRDSDSIVKDKFIVQVHVAAASLIRPMHRQLDCCLSSDGRLFLLVNATAQLSSVGVLKARSLKPTGLSRFRQLPRTSPSALPACLVLLVAVRSHQSAQVLVLNFSVAAAADCLKKHRARNDGWRYLGFFGQTSNGMVDRQY